jgi:integrase
MDTQAQLLMSFIGHLERAGAPAITTELAVAWARLPQHAQPIQWNHRLSAVRGFAKHLQTLDQATEIPPRDVLAARQDKVPPYLYSAADISALLGAAAALTPPPRAALYQTLIGLLVVTGMRSGEAVRLDRGHVDLDARLITIVGSKFGKSRQIPLHTSTITALHNYAQVRDQRFPATCSPSFLVTSIGTRPHRVTVQKGFADLVDAIGLQPGPGDAALDCMTCGIRWRGHHAGLVPPWCRRPSPASGAFRVSRPRRSQIDLLLPARTLGNCV